MEKETTGVWWQEIAHVALKGSLYSYILYMVLC